MDPTSSTIPMEERKATMTGTASSSTPLSTVGGPFNAVSGPSTGSLKDGDRRMGGTDILQPQPQHHHSHHHQQLQQQQQPRSFPFSQHTNSPFRPKSPDSITADSTTASVSTGADWPTTPTLTSAVDISSPSTPVHDHVIAAVFQQQQQQQQQQQHQSTESSKGSNTNQFDPSTIPTQSPSSTSATAGSNPGQGPTTGSHHPNQPSEQLKRNWLTAWIQSQPRPDSSNGFVSTDPSRSASPGFIQPSSSTSNIQNQTIPYPDSTLKKEKNGEDDNDDHEDNTNRLRQLPLSTDLDPTTPTLASVQQKHQHHSIATSTVPVGNYETARRQSWTKDHPGPF